MSVFPVMGGDDSCYSAASTPKENIIKHLTVVIHAELEIPDDWEVVDHPSGMQVLKVGDQFVDFDLAPLATRSTEDDAEWSDADTALIDQVLDAVVELDAELEFIAQH